MCDYSLHNVASRPAKVGDELVTTTFTNCLTRGFSAPAQPNVAVCLLPGTEIAFKKDAEYDHPFALLTLGFGLGKLREKVARFRQIDVARRHAHHDALEFANGKIVLVTRLSIGQRATVLQLPAQALEAATQSEELKQLAPVG
jgi:hypothetical protein